MNDHDRHWCDREERLLRRWAEKAAGYRWLHNHARLHYKWLTDMLTYPCIIISSITGVGGFAVLNPSDDNISSDMRRNIIIFQYTFAFLNVIAGILTSVSKFSNSSSMMEAHSSMCIQYSKFYRNIDMELSLDAEHRSMDAIEFVNKQRQEYDRLLDEAPDIPHSTICEFNKTFPDKDNKPDVCNGLNVIEESSDNGSDTKVRNAIARWLKRSRGNKSFELSRGESV
jgi:hypothetical protein